MKRLYLLLLGLALVGQACWAEDLLDNADLAPGNDLGEPVIIRLLPAGAGQAAVIEQQGTGNRAALDQNGQALLGRIVQAGGAQEAYILQEGSDLMAIISINLGVMNLLPVPVLDGFHVLSAGFEWVRRRPISLRAREIANVVGLAMLLLMMAYVMRNDVVRYFFN